MDKEYLELFSCVKSTLKKQKKAKSEGINDYNILSVVRKPTHEVGMHSNVIYSLLDPKGKHNQGYMFLEFFIINVLGFDKIDDFGCDISVAMEELTEKNRRVDFTIKSEKYLIGIEMKINANDEKNQVFDYFKHLKDESETNGIGQKVEIYYLTKNGKSPSRYSLGTRYPCDYFNEKNIKNISFITHISNWIEQCHSKMEQLAYDDLRYAIGNYKNIVDLITGKYKSKIMTIADEITASGNESLLKSALQLDKELIKIKSKVLFNFFNDVRNELSDVDDTTDISSKIVSQSRVVDSEGKCLNWFKAHEGQRNKGKNTKENVGIVFDCNFTDNLFLYVMVAFKGLHYGVVKLDEKFEFCNVLTPVNYQSMTERKGWPSLKTWYSQENPLPINKLLDLSNNETLINFKSSKFKLDIENLIKVIPKKSG